MNTFENIREKLEQKKIGFEVVEFKDEAVAMRESDTSVGKNYDPKNAIKTLIVDGKSGPAAVVLKGDGRIDKEKLKSIIGKWSVVRDLEERFGFIPGTVCPLVLEMPMFVDKSALDMEVWSMGAGDSKKGFNVKLGEIIKHLKFTEVNVTSGQKMNKFSIDKKIFDKLPHLRIGVLVANDVNNNKDSEVDFGDLKCNEDMASRKVAEWHNALEKVSINPKNHAPSIETLTNLLVKGKMSNINPLVDIYNKFSLENLVPVGAHDLDKVDTIELRYTNNGDFFEPLNETTRQPSNDGAVAYISGNSIMTSHWVWKQGKVSIVDKGTKKIFIPIDIIDEKLTDSEVVQLIKKLAVGIHGSLGGRFSFEILSVKKPEIDLSQLTEIKTEDTILEITEKKKLVEEKIKLISRNCQEVLTVEDLRKLIDSGTPLTHYIGFEISGQVHLGTGLISMGKIADFLKAGAKCKIFLADFHSYLNNKLGGNFDNIRWASENYFKQGLIASLKCFGVDESEVEFISGNELYKTHPEHWETFMRVGKHVTLSRNMRSISIMGKSQGQDVDMATLFYPPLQVADIFTMNVNLAHAGIDQRKAHVIAREVGEKIGKWTPIAIHQNLIAGLTPPEPGKNDEETLKMSKSKPNSAIFVHDTPDEIREKIKKAYGPPKEVEFNPLINWVQTLVFWGEDEGEFRIERAEKFGGNLVYTRVADLIEDYKSGALFPLDLKNGLSEWLIAKLEPARKHFEEAEAKEGLRKMKELLGL